MNRQNQAVLDNNASQINVLLQTALQNAQTQLRTIAFFSVSSGFSQQAFAEQAKPLLTNPTSSVALVDISGGQPKVVLASGNDLHANESLAGPLASAVLAAGPPLSSGVVQVGNKTLLYLEAAASTNPRYVALQTSVVDPKTRTANATGPYSKVFVNVYDGTKAQPGRLIVTTYGPRRLPRPVATATTKFGSVMWLVQVSAKTSPSGAWAEASPWVWLAVGVIVAIGLAVLVERLGRRREQAERLAADLDRVAEDNRRLYTEQRSVAETLQAALLPETLPDLSTAELAARYLPGVQGIHVGGDWYDVIAGENGVLAVVGDVSGRGLRAASAMASLLYATRAYAAQGDPPAVILSKLSNVLSVERTGQFATVLLLLIDVAGHQVTVVNGGHPPPLLLHDSSGQFIDTDVGVPVGLSPHGSYVPVTVPVPPGSTLLAFTDGLVERRGEDLDAGLERLRHTAVHAHNGSLDGLLTNVMQTLVGDDASDDTVLLGVRWRT